jgi:hypothetical protein
MVSLIKGNYCLAYLIIILGSSNICDNLFTFHLLNLAVFFVLFSLCPYTAGAGLATSGTTELISLTEFYSIENSALFAVFLVLKSVVTITS